MKTSGSTFQSCWQSPTRLPTHAASTIRKSSPGTRRSSRPCEKRTCTQKSAARACILGPGRRVDGQPEPPEARHILQQHGQQQLNAPWLCYAGERFTKDDTSTFFDQYLVNERGHAHNYDNCRRLTKHHVVLLSQGKVGVWLAQQLQTRSTRSRSTIIVNRAITVTPLIQRHTIIYFPYGTSQIPTLSYDIQTKRLAAIYKP